MINRVIERTRKIYDAIANEWDISRPILRPERQKLARKVKIGQSVLDIGCGNGILYEFLAPKSIDYTGLDFSQKLLAIARRRSRSATSNLSSRAKAAIAAEVEGSRRSRYKFVLGEATKLPFKDNTFDWVFALAVYHHLPSAELRRKALEEVQRVLKPGGKLALTVWNLLSEYAREKYKIRLGENDVFIPWRATAGATFERYAHIFKRKELRDLLIVAGFKDINVSYIMHVIYGAPGEITEADVKQGRDLSAVAIKPLTPALPLKGGGG